MSGWRLITMIVGLVTAAVPMLTNNATVLYTFYPPMLAEWSFYLGLTLLVVGSWIVGYSIYFTYYAWRKENPDACAPFIALASRSRWCCGRSLRWASPLRSSSFCCPTALAPVLGSRPLALGSAAEPHALLVVRPPAGLFLAAAGLRLLVRHVARADQRQDVQRAAGAPGLLALPAPEHAGRLPSPICDPASRKSGSSSTWIFTFGVGFPSLFTAFTVVASLEIGARARGGKGYLVGSAS
jgi:cytochrome c oxidase subunit 1